MKRPSFSPKMFALSAVQAAVLTAGWSSCVHAGTYNPDAFASLGVLQPLVGSVVFDTDAVTVQYQSLGISGPITTTLHGVVDTPENGRDVAVFAFGEVSVLGGVGIKVVGSRPLALLSSGSVLLGSNIDVSGAGSAPGPGGGAGGTGSDGTGHGPGGGQPSSTDPQLRRSVGGGGGFGGNGGDGGGADTVPFGLSRGGPSYGDLGTALEGGSGGGATPDEGKSGGGGGGAIEIVARKLALLTNVFARGSGGLGAGGGSGGGIVIAAESILYGGTLDASGGDGNAGGGGGGGGRILIAPGTYTWGGQFAANVAPGSSAPSRTGQAGVVTLAPRLTMLAAGQVLDLDTVSASHPFADKPEVEFVLGTLGIAAGGIGYATSSHNAVGDFQLSGGLLATPGGLELDGHALRGYGNQVGRLHVDRDALLIADGGHLVVGDANIAGVLSLEGGVAAAADSTLVLNQANVVHLNGGTELNEGSRLVSVNGAQLDNGTVMEVDGEAEIQGAFINQGSVRVAPVDSSLTFLNDVHGAGSFAGTIVFHADYSPGNSPATIDFGGGDAIFDAASELTMEIGGAAESGAYDRLTNINTLDFHGLLKLVFTGGFTPSPGAVFDLFDFNQFTGSLAPERIVVIGFDAARLDLSRLAIDGKLSAVPLPGALWPFGLACAALIQRSRKSRGSRSGRAPACGQ